MTELLFLLLAFSVGILGLIHLGRFLKRLPAHFTGKPSWPTLSSRLKVIILSLILIPVLTLLMGVVTFFHSTLVKAAGNLTVEIISGYNLIVDSNVESPSSYAPSVATVAGKFCNTGDASLANVQTFIGDYKGGVGDTPGIYPTRDSSTAAFIAQHPHLANTNLYSFGHVGGSIGLRDASRFIGTLAPGECRIQYWHFTYPRRANPNNSGVAVWGNTNDPNDDLWLNFDIWGTATGGVSVGATRKATMRNEITAMANKIQPNGGVWFNTNTAIAKPGDVITSNGVRYELGVINKGFDNDGDNNFDYNAWLQPIGDPSYDPSCFRLVRTSGVLTVSRSGGNPDLIMPFTDQLYFTNLPTDNNGVIGNVYYTFMAMGGPCNVSLTPYQEVASGADNEKYNGDYGTSLPPVQSSDPDVEIDKTGNVTVTLGGSINYQIPTSNVGTTDAGLPLSSGSVSGTTSLPWVPLVLSDTIPTGMIYKQGSATHTFTTTGVIILYSMDQGQTWSNTEPAVYSAVTSIQWWLTDTLKPGETGRVLFGVTVPNTYTQSYIENCADGSFAAGTAFDRACTTTLVQGPNVIGDQVWRDDNGNGVLDGGENGLASVGVQLYLDKNGNGSLDSGDLLVMTTTSTITGYYTFNNLPNGNFLVQVDSTDPDIPFGYSSTTNELYAVTLNNNNYLAADFGFGPSLSLDKQQLTSPVFEGQQVTYTLSLRNLRPGDGTGQTAACTYDVWANNFVEAGTDWVNPTNAIGVAGPNSTYAVGDFSGNGDVLEGSGFTFPASTGNIVSVQAIYSLYMGGSPLATSGQFDIVQGRIYTNSTLISSTTFANSFLNTNFAGVANQKVLTWNVTSTRPGWSFADFARLSTELYLQKTGGADGAIMNLDALGYRVTTDQQCGGSRDAINPAPLSDTFDASQYQFVSATPAQSSLSSATSPYPNTGILSWSNIGPLYAGQTKVVTVVLKALEPANNVTTTITNTAAVSGATFTTGEPTNSATDMVTDTLRPTASIGDYVWRDQDGDGIQDPAEVGIAGVVISLTANVTITLNGQSYAAGTTLTTTTTASGLYLFEGLYYTGRYTVSVATASLPIGSGTLTPTYDLATGFDPIITNNRTSFTLTPTITGSSDDQLGADFGYQLPSLIAGTIWHDWNHNGSTTQDTGEEGLAGVVVTLTDSIGTVVATTTTTASGYYSFAGNFNGTYTVAVNTSSGPLASGSWTQSFDTNGLATPNQSSVTIVTGGYGQADFSYYQTGLSDLGDTVYTDWNGDGDQDTGEEGISGVTVWLYEDTNNDGLINTTNDTLVMTATTTITGYYLFPNLPADSFIVVVNQANLPFPVGGYNQTDDPDATLDSQSAITTNGTTDILTVDFGYQPFGTGAIGNFVWRDNDRDGLQDTGEPGIANITVSLYEDTDGNRVISPTVDALVMTTTTNASGIYSFDNLPADNYLVQVDATDPDLPQDSYGNPFVLSSGNNPISVTLATGQIYLNADFGFTAGGTIGDLIWRDDDQDASADATEPGISGVTIRLYNDLNGDGLFSITDTLVASTTTSVTGIYSFTSLPAGQYVVVVDTTTTPTSTFTYDLNGSLDGQAGVTLTAGQVFLGADFGLPNTNGSIGDQLWIDLNGNGTYEISEPGLAGVIITLTNSSGVAITTTTDTDGFYLLPNLISGTYTVTVRTTDLPAGLSQSFELDGSLNHQTVVTLANGQNNLNVDFGYVPNLSVSKSSASSSVPLQAGGSITYTIIVSNPSPVIVAGAAISDTIPDNTSFVPGSLTIAPASAASLVVPAGNPPIIYVSPITIGANSLVTLTFQVAVTNPMPIGADTITNTVLLTSTAGVTGTDTVTDIVSAPSADVIIAKSVSPNSTTAGGILTYTLVYTNNGPATANNVTITDTLPANITFGGVVAETPSITGPTQAGQELVWTVGSLASAGSGSIVFTTTVDSSASGAITNSAIITTTTPDNIPNNNIGSASTTIFTPSITIAKTPDSQQVVSGSTVTFTLTVTNTGDVTLTNIAVTDPLAPNCATTLATLAPNASSSYTCTLSNVTLDFTNVATATGTPPTGPDVSDNDPADVDVISPSITLAKTPDLQTIASGDTVTFTLTVTNTGDVTLTNVSVSDPLGGVCTPTNLGTLTVGQSNTAICVRTNVILDFTNVATATGTPPTGSDVSDNDDANVDVIRPGLTVDKSVNIARVAPHQIVSYTIRITNTGDVTINPVRVTDTLDAGLSYQPGTANPAPSAISGQQLVWNDVTGGAGLTPGASTQITLLAAVTTTIGIYGNSVAVDGDHPTGTITPPVTDTVTTVVEDPSIDLDKEVSAPGVVGDLITFTIRITNTGPSTLDQVPLFDSFTGPVQYVGGTPLADTVDQVNRQLAWNDLTTFFGDLAPGRSILITTVFRLTTTGDEFSMTNMASVTGANDVFNNNANNDQDSEILTNIPTAIDLLYFTSQQVGQAVALRWATAVEYDNYGFRLLRSTTGNLADAVEVGFVAGQGQGTASGATYEFADSPVEAGQTYTYWLVDVDFNGTETLHPETTSISPSAGGGATNIYLPLIFR